MSNTSLVTLPEIVPTVAAPAPAAANPAMLAIAQAAAALAALAQSLQAGGAPAVPALSIVPNIVPTVTVAPAAAPPSAPGQVTLRLSELVNEFLKAKARAGRSDRYLRQLRVSLNSFAAGRGFVAINEVTCHDIDKWMIAQDWRPKTARGYLGDVKTLFNFGVRRGYLQRNPAEGVELPELSDEGPICIFNPEEVAQVLDYARKVDLNIMRHLAVRFFGGVRTAEAHRLTEKDLRLDHGVLEVPAMKSKTRSRRLVTIQPNLKAWLDLGGELGPIGPMRVRAVIVDSKVVWMHNVARHSFCSYHLAQFQSAAKTALEAGHTEAMLFRNYRALVTPAQAETYWSIFPK